MKADAQIRNAGWDVTHQIVWGHVYNDSKGRFRDGAFIHTSLVQNAKRPEQPKQIKTLNSVYDVEWAEEES